MKSRWFKRTSLSFLAVVLAALLVTQASAAPGDTVLVSVASDGTQGNSSSGIPNISADGRYVVFASIASNLAPGDTNGVADIFLHDMHTGTTTRISVASDGTQANGPSNSVSISADGRYVVFDSHADNLVPGDTNGMDDVFLHDMQTGITARISLASDGTQGNQHSDTPFISADEHYVVFRSFASNLVPGDTNGKQDVFLRDIQTGKTSRISIASDGRQGNDASDIPTTASPISSNGRYIVFNSWASNLVPGDTNESADVFLRDMQEGTTTRISLGQSGEQGNNRSFAGPISPDGRFVAFWSLASNLVPGDTNNNFDVFLRDLQRGTTARISVASDGTQGNDESVGASITPNGRFVAFESWADNLVSGDANGVYDVFIRDNLAQTTIRISVASDGTQGNRSSNQEVINTDGRYVVFTSNASNLVPGDTNGTKSDVFVHENNINAFIVVMGGNTFPLNGSVLAVGPNPLKVQFNKDVRSDDTSTAANNVNNYLLVEAGPDATFQTHYCVGGAVADDTALPINSIAYNASTFTATLTINGSMPLTAGTYRLFICGTTSVTDLNGNKLNDGLSDSIITFTVSPHLPSTLPATGFAPGRVAALPIQPAAKAYNSLGDLWLEIPRLGVQIPIVGVPQSQDGTWDVSWLGNQAGWLNGTAFPTWKGNSVLTGHVYDAYGRPGPFMHLNSLWWGDKVIIHAGGTQYVYEVREVTQVSPEAISSAIKHEELPWLTLITCRGYDEASNSYRYRVVARAVLIEVK